MKFIKYIDGLLSKLRKDVFNTTIDDSENPWNGLASYSDPDNNDGKPVKLFCGRDNETFKLTQQIKNQIFVTVYGKSGNGKTSLLNAGVCPKLRDEQFFPISIRLGSLDKDVSFQEYIISEIEKQQTIRKEVIEVVKYKEDEKNTDVDYLWKYFARRMFYKDDKMVFPVIILDQFEEVFRDRQEDAALLLKQIYFMMDESHALPDRDINGMSYEYYFNFRFVVVIREDDLYKLEDTIDSNYLSLMKENRYRLRAITKDGAREVILKPGEKFFAESDKEKIADTIINIATDNDNNIGANVLSLLCSRIYVQKLKEKIIEPLSDKHVENFVLINPLEQFYAEATKDLTSKERTYLEDNLVDVSGRRCSVPIANYYEAVKKGKSLISGTTKILQENNGRIELIHDSFCPVLEGRKAQRSERWRSIVEYILLFYVILCSVIAWFCLPYSNNDNSKIVSFFVYGNAFINAFVVVVLVRKSHRVIYPTLGIVCCFFTLILFLYPDNFPSTFGTHNLLFIISILMLLVFDTIVLFICKNTIQNKEKMTLIEYLDSRRLWNCQAFFLFGQSIFLGGGATSLVDFSVAIAILSFSFGSNVYGSIITFFIAMPMGLIFGNANESSFFVFYEQFPLYWLLFVFVVLIWMILFSDSRFECKEKIASISIVIMYYVFLFVIYLIAYKNQFWFLVIWPTIIVFLGYIIERDIAKHSFARYVISLIFIIGGYSFLLGYNPKLKGVDQSLQVGKWQWNAVLKESDSKIEVFNARTCEKIIETCFDSINEKGRLLVKSKYCFVSHYDGYMCHRDSTLSCRFYPDTEYSLFTRKANHDPLALTFCSYRDLLFKHLIRGEGISSNQYQNYIDSLLMQENTQILNLLKTGRSIKEYKDYQKILFKLLDNALSSSYLKTVSVDIKEYDNQNLKQLVDAFNLFAWEHREIYDEVGDYDYITGFEDVADEYLKVDNGCVTDSLLVSILPLLKDEYEDVKNDCSYKLNLGHKIERLEEIADRFHLYSEDDIYECDDIFGLYDDKNE